MVISTLPDPSLQQDQLSGQQLPVDDSASQVMMQAAVQTALQQDDQGLNPPHPTPSTAKEQGPSIFGEVGIELPAGMQSVEELRSPEISPEVEKYIEEVKEDPTHFTKEVVVADQKLIQPATQFVAQPVIILPITAEEMKEAKRAPITSSRRWLAEWTEKIIKMFAGSVVYRE